MVIPSLVFVLLQLTSLGICILGVAEYRRITRERCVLLAAMECDVWSQKKTITLWIYIAVTVFVSLATTAFFLTQPHLL